MKNNTYLYEIGTEEIPASYIRPAATYLQEYFSKKLKEAQLEFTEIKHFSITVEKDGNKKALSPAKGGTKKQHAVDTIHTGLLIWITFYSKG